MGTIKNISHLYFTPKKRLKPQSGWAIDIHAQHFAGRARGVALIDFLSVCLETELANSTIEIVSITTGRGSYLIGPASAFGSKTRDLVIRDRPRIQGILIQFVSQPGTVDQLRPNIRRWGLSHSHSMLNEREWMREALLKAVSTGQLLISVAPDVTRGFSVPHAAIVRKTTSVAKAQALVAQPHLPVDLDDRLIIVMQMVPDYMSGATKAAFLRTLEDVGVGMIVGGLLAWIGAHFIPGINIAMLAFDLFFLGSDVIKACETIGAQIDGIRKAKSRQDLEPAAKAIAGAIAVMLVKGVFNRLLRAKSAPKAMSKKNTHAIHEKPNMGGDKAPKREARRPAQADPPPPAVKKAPPVDDKATAEAIKSASTFKTKGLSRAEAHEYLKTDDGRKMLDELRRADPKAGDKVIYQRARSMLSSGDIPKRMDAPGSLVKIVPAGEGVSGHSPFFTTEKELNKAMASGKPLHEYFGLPKKSEAASYDLYKMTPKEPTTVFSSKVAPTSELGGQIRKTGGGEQIIVPNRKAFSEPELMPISIPGP